MHWALIAAVNDDEVLNGTLLRSPDVPDASQVLLKRGFRTAGEAYNSALEECRAEVAVFIHQDVYLPPGWAARLEECICEVQSIDTAWGVLGVYGVDPSGRGCGHVYSTGLGRTLGQAGGPPVRATSIDEMVIVVRTRSGLRFDPNLPGYHLYGTDICCEARARGFSTFVVTAFCVHNSNGIPRLPRSFWDAYFYLRRKRRSELPIHTCCAEITLGYSFYIRSVLASMRRTIAPSPVGERHPRPEELYARLRDGAGLPGDAFQVPLQDRRLA